MHFFFPFLFSSFFFVKVRSVGLRSIYFHNHIPNEQMEMADKICVSHPKLIDLGASGTRTVTMFEFVKWVWASLPDSVKNKYVASLLTGSSVGNFLSFYVRHLISPKKLLVPRDSCPRQSASLLISASTATITALLLKNLCFRFGGCCWTASACRTGVFSAATP